MMKLKLKPKIRALIIAVAVVASIGFVEKKQSERAYNAIKVKIGNQLENYFINENDILKVLENQGGPVLIGATTKDVDLGEIEKLVASLHYVDKADVYRDYQGTLNVQILQSRPMARIVRPTAPDAYISTSGKILPLSDRFTARTLLISGGFTERLLAQPLLEDEQNKPVFDMVSYINENRFWKAQVAQLDIDRSGKITIYPQVTKQLIRFGKADEVGQKFKKIKIFYDRILPYKGWNHYQEVNVKYKDQIICK